jgi:hypothetical protein
MLRSKPTWFFSFFDSYAIRRRLRKGEIVEDVEIFDYSVLIKNKKVVGAIMLLLGVLGVANAFEHSVLSSIFGGDFYWAVKRSIIPIALVLTGAYILLSTRKTEARAEDSDIEE